MSQYKYIHFSFNEVKTTEITLPVKHSNKHLIELTNIACYFNALDELQTMKSSSFIILKDYFIE